MSLEAVQTLTNSEPSHWVHNLSPFAFRFSDSVGIRYYGLAYITAFLVAAYLLRVYWKAGRSMLAPNVQASLLISLIIGVLLGGRLGYFLLYSPQTLWKEPIALLRIWDGGMASHGGFAGVLLALVWMVRKYRVPWRNTADVLVTLAPPGLLFGRIANFINGELWGKVSHMPWAVIFPASAPIGTPINQIQPRHPSQLYEALLEGLLLFLFTQMRFWRSGVIRDKPGALAGEFLVLYGIVRILGEAFREPDASMLFGMSRGTFYSCFVILGGLVLLATSRRRRTAIPQG